MVRAKTITITGENFKPKTRLYAFFEKVDVSSYCTPASTTYTSDSTIVAGSPMITSATGKIEATFAIPDPKISGNPQFLTGELMFRLTSRESGGRVSLYASIGTAGETTYYASGLLETKQETIIATRNAIVVRNRTNQSTSYLSDTAGAVITHGQPRQIAKRANRNWTQDGGYDPGDVSPNANAAAAISNVDATENGVDAAAAAAASAAADAAAVDSNDADIGMATDSNEGTADVDGVACFIPEAKVLMADGTYKQIIDVKIDDQVMSLQGPNTVIDTFVSSASASRNLHGFNDIAPFITSTHPIKTDKGWANFNPDSYKRASPEDYALVGKENNTGEVLKLQEGDNIQFYNPGFKSLENHVIEQRDKDFKVYNLTLDGDHTFVVEGIVVHNKCFRADTQVILSDGSRKFIQDVKVGDELLGKDNELNEILDLHRPKLGLKDDILPQPLRMTSINGGGYDASEDHMFMTTDGWKTPTPEVCKILHENVLEQEGVENIQALQVGDNLVTSNGIVEITSIDIKSDDPTLQLYNFMLTGNRTYHVVMEGHNEAMLVHNKGGGDGGGKVLCTALNSMYGFGSFRNTIWMKYNTTTKSTIKYPVTKILELGYHKIAGPLSDKMPNSPFCLLYTSPSPRDRG